MHTRFAKEIGELKDAKSADKLFVFLLVSPLPYIFIMPHSSKRRTQSDVDSGGRVVVVVVMVAAAAGKGGRRGTPSPRPASR